MRKLLLAITVASLSLSLVSCSSNKKDNEAGKYQDGTYTASSKGFNGDVTVEVTISSGKISAVSFDTSTETVGKGSLISDEYPEKIIEAQSAEVDDISGATITSEAAKTALTKALDEASGKTVNAEEVTLKDGIYTAEKYGFQQIQPLAVTTVIENNTIKDIAIDSTIDSVAMVRSVKELMIPRIIDQQSITVDAITGATATSNAVLAAVKDCVEQSMKEAGTDISNITVFDKGEEIPNKGKEETINVDVLVVGLGAAGTAALLSTAETQKANGKEVSVLGIEKAGRWGGTGAFTGSIMAVNAEGIKNEFNDGKDYMDGEDLYNTWLEYTEGDAKETIIKKFLDNSGDTVDWLYYDHGMLLTEPSAYFGSKWACVYDYVSRNTYEDDRVYSNDYDGTEKDDGQNTMVDKYYQRLYKDIEALGGKYMLETEAQLIIYDEKEDKVVGIKALNHDGTEYTIYANSVVLATGGFAGSEELEVEYLGQNPYYEHLGDEQWHMIGMSQNDGKMLKSATEIGAGTYNADMPPMVHFAGTNIVLHDYPVNTYDDGSINLWYGWDFTWSLNDVPNAMVLSSNIPWVAVDGKRFTKEGALFSWWKAGPSYWAVYDQAIVNNIKANGFANDVKTYANETQGGVKGNIPIPEIQDILDKLVDSNQIIKADTLEELAEKMGVNQDTFMKQMETYNKDAADGFDTEFEKDSEKMVAIENGPYYAIKGYSHTFATCGGLDIDEDFRVLMSDGETPIEGLYAAGEEASGVMYTDKKPYVTYGGAALGFAYTSGRLVGIEVGK